MRHTVPGVTLLWSIDFCRFFKTLNKFIYEDTINVYVLVLIYPTMMQFVYVVRKKRVYLHLYTSFMPRCIVFKSVYQNAFCIISPRFIGTDQLRERRFRKEDVVVWSRHADG